MDDVDLDDDAARHVAEDENGGAGDVADDVVVFVAILTRLRTRLRMKMLWRMMLTGTRHALFFPALQSRMGRDFPTIRGF